MDTYKTIEKPSEAFLKEKGSKFYGYAYPVKNEEEVRDTLQDLRKQYYDASHHCYAYRLGADHAVFRANDDGEPNHSAGDPILGQIKSFELTDVLVVVVRYFGGTKLGVGGLISAYKEAAQMALEAAETIEKTIYEKIVLEFPYDRTNEVMRLVNTLEIVIEQQSFTDRCILHGLISPKNTATLATQTALWQDVKISS